MTPLRFSCRDVDELAGALAVGAVDADEARAARQHLASCSEPHAELRALLGADVALAAGLDPVQPSAGLRDRLMSSVDALPRDQPAPAVSPVRAQPARRGWLDWLSPQVARPLAVAAVAAVVAVGIWGVTLSGQLADRDRALRDVAAAISGGQAAFRVEGSGGRGYVVDTPGSGATFVVADVGSLPADRLYELWLIGPDGPVGVGTFRPGADAVAAVPVDRDLSGFDTFAVTVESQRVSAPTTQPVMKGPLGS
jgi:anti-sigma-K factor RskA